MPTYDDTYWVPAKTYPSCVNVNLRHTHWDYSSQGTAFKHIVFEAGWRIRCLKAQAGVRVGFGV